MNKRGQTPLHMVADSSYDHPELSKSLIKHGAKADGEGTNHCTWHVDEVIQRLEVCCCHMGLMQMQ